MRGKAEPHEDAGAVSGITPAYAGKSAARSPAKPLRRDHPRVCGEKSGPPAACRPCSGSPPRMRGKAIMVALVCHSLQDHPRVCGEKPTGRDHSGRDQGSPPRMRGKGKYRNRDKRATKDHPRVCGEKLFMVVTDIAPVGSPPRMRGKAPVLPCGLVSVGITPAYAGKRLKRSRSTVPPVAIVPLFSSVCNKSVVSDGSPAGRDAPLFLPAENAVPASPAYNLRSL